MAAAGNVEVPTRPEGEPTVSFLEKLAKELERIAGTHTVPVELNVDEAGYLDRSCPHDPCSRGFKVMHADSDMFADHAWCVYCGRSDDCNAFSTKSQSDHAEAVMIDHVDQLFNKAHRNAAQATPTTTRTYGGKCASVTITESVTPPPRLKPPKRTPPDAWAVMRVEAACDRCECRFAGIGGCFFCPACGHRSVDLTLEETLRRIRDALSKEPELVAAIGNHSATEIMTKMSEADVQTLVSAFETFAKGSFPRLAPTAPTPGHNAFQNLARGSGLWSRYGGRPFAAILSTSEHEELKRLFQQRHVLAHGSGIVDAAYLTNTNDTTYVSGQRLAIKPAHVFRMADLIEKLVAGLRADLPA